MLYFNEFYLPVGSSLMIYNQNSDMVVGPLNSENNHEDGEFSHRLLKGDSITLEYYEPTNLIEVPLINISNVYHAYKDILGFYDSDRDRNCGENVECDDGTFEDQINSVIYLEMSGYICSAALINNASFDLTPYYWTAWHCVDGENPSTFRFYFDYETSSCSGSWASQGVYEYGGNLLSDSDGVDPDYALILITDNTISDGIFYAGWNRSSSNPTISCGVHHPDGDPKKINFDNDTATSSGQIYWGDGYGSSPAGSHWNVYWDEGGTEGGSSGSPLFDSNQRIVGQLSGGSGECGQGSDSYGKLARAWSTSNIENWLDPTNSGATAIDGIYTAGEADYITVTDPNGGEILESGGSFNITWDSNASSNISIKLYINSSFNSNITTNTSNDGSYSWNIPSSLSQGSNYKIKITSTSDSNIYDYSDGTFSISSPAVNLSIGNIDVNGGVIDIDMSNDSPVSGFQFVLTDNPDYITITGAGAGLSGSYGFTTSTNESGTILGFSLSGAQIPAGNNTLIELGYSDLCR